MYAHKHTHTYTHLLVLKDAHSTVFRRSL